MNLDDVPIVKSDDRRGMLYVVCSVSDGSGNGKLVLRASYGAKLHENVLLGFSLEELADSGLDVVCLAGGFMYVDLAVKGIFIWGQSGNYGREPRGETVKLLREAYPDCEIIVDRSPFVRK
ncbi:MAG: hypothetical protein HZA94_03565 [Candidatus Vogelbacteria bacterium]|nr:hypothetical protein [Candidatus Vogelbacteria bacterium]